MPSFVGVVCAYRAAAAANRNVVSQAAVIKLNSACFSSGEWGSGAGKGGGTGGAVREAGGVFGKMEAAREEEYFKKLQRQQLMKMKSHLKEEIKHHEKMINQHKEAIERHMERINALKQDMPPKTCDKEAEGSKKEAVAARSE